MLEEKKIQRVKKRTVKKWDNETPTAEYFNELFRVSKNQIIWGGGIIRLKIYTFQWVGYFGINA